MDMKEALNSAQEKIKVVVKLAEMVANGFGNAVLISGRGGLGKSFQVRKVLQDSSVDFEILRGYYSPVALYNFLYEFRDKVILIDDCDSVFKDTTGLNILKAVLETAPVRRVKWNSPSQLVSVQEFEFTGRIIFLTNFNSSRLNNHMEALMTRVHYYELDMSTEEVIAYVRHLAMHVEHPQVLREDRLKVVRWMRDNAVKLNFVNVRTYLKALDVFAFDKKGWRKLLTTMLSNG